MNFPSEWAVFPLFGLVDGKCQCGKPLAEDGSCGGTGNQKPGKHPMYAYSQLGPAEHVEGPPGCNYAVATGSRSGVFVLDFDTLEAYQRIAADLPETFTVATGRGMHVYFRCPDFPVKTSAKELARDVDVRGEGGYVVAPDSTHASGKTYEVTKDVEPSPAPAWLLAWEGLRGRVTHAPAESVIEPLPRDHPRYAPNLASFVDFCQHAPAAVQGEGGSGALWQVALRGAVLLALQRDDVRAIILEHYNPRCDPPWSEAELDHKLDGVCTGAVAAEKQALKPMEAWLDGRAPAPREDGHVYTFDPCKALRPTKFRTDPESGETKRQGLRPLEMNELVFELGEAWKFRYNEFDDRVYAMAPPARLAAEGGASRLSDEDVTALRVWLEVVKDAKPTYVGDIASAASAIARAHAYHPVRDWLNALPAPTTKHLDQLASVLFGDDRQIAQEYVRKQLIGSVARIMRPGCQMDTVLVLVGPKGGERKSTAIAALYRVPGCETFRSNLPDIKDMQKIGPALDGCWVAELAELAVVRRSDVETLKDFLTRKAERYSPKWVKGEVSRPRMCVLWGSTNEERFLDKYDSAFRRRFLTVHMAKRVDVAWLEEHRAEIWAEAMAAWRAGESWWFEDEDQADAGRQDFVVSDPWEDAIQRLLDGTKADFITTYDICKAVLGEGKVPAPADYSHASKIMRRLGFAESRPREGEKRLRGFVLRSKVIPITAKTLDK